MRAIDQAVARHRARLAKQCGARGGRTLASFVGKGRGALPVQPGAAMMAHYLGDVATKLGAAPEDGVVMQIATDAEQPSKARAFPMGLGPNRAPRNPPPRRLLA